MIPGAFLTIGILFLLWRCVLLPNSLSPWKKRSARLPCRRAGATPRTFWAAESRKSGVAPARFGIFSTVTLASSECVFLPFARTSRPLRVKKLPIRKVQNVILTFFTEFSWNVLQEPKSDAPHTFRNGRSVFGHLFQ